MSTIGTVESLWRYPVKSMRGQESDEFFVGFSGIFGDRLFAFKSSAGAKGFPYLTSREQRMLLQCTPRFRHPDKSFQPPNLAEAENLAPGLNLNPLPGDPQDLMVDVETPAGETVAIDDPALEDVLCEGMPDRPELTLLRSERAMTDCRPVSLLSVQAVRQFGQGMGTTLDYRRFRPNIYLDLNTEAGTSENDLVGRSVRIGSKVVISILERDPRCVVITLDPDTGEKNPAVLKQIAQAHDGTAGVYGAVLVEGMVRKGDAVELLD